jgi:acyl-CoA thioesterase-2
MTLTPLPTSTLATRALVDALSVESTGQEHRFVAPPCGGHGFRMFGGMLMAQAVGAAGRTVDDGRVDSVQATFLRPGDRHVPVDIEVRRLFDGRSYRSRQVLLSQHGQMLVTAVISFRANPDDPRLCHVDRPPYPSASLLPAERHLSPWTDQAGNASACPVEVRRVPGRCRHGHDRHGSDGRGHARRGHNRGGEDAVLAAAPAGNSTEPLAAWLRIAGLGSDSLLHLAAVTYASDLLPMEAAMVASGYEPCSDELTWATLSHSLWFHRTPSADRWMLFHHDSPVAGGGQAMVTGSLHDEEGSLVATFVQQGAVRPNRAPQQDQAA